ncbi:hypothetical protein [Streptomyces sp. NPDC006335]
MRPGGEQWVRHGLDPKHLLARSRAMETPARDNATQLTDAFLDRVANTSV